jgi:YVTN family beta-propeller protein
MRWLITRLFTLTLLILTPTAGAETFAYIADLGGISVINTTTNTVTATIAIGGGQWGVAVNPAGTRVYVTNRLGNNVSVINTATNTIIASIIVGASPHGVVVNPAGTRIYVSGFDNDNVLVIDTDTNTIIATIPVGSEPYGITTNPAGTRVYVANYTGNTVSVINTTTNTVTATIAVGLRPRGVTINPAGTVVYVANRDSNTVSVINTTTNTVIATIAVGTSPVGVAVNPSGTMAYVANQGSNNVSVIDTATNTVTATIAVGVMPISMGSFIEFVQPAPTSPDNPKYLIINRTDADTDEYTQVSNPVRVTYSFPGCNAAELSLAMSAPGIGLPWSYLNSNLNWQALPADLSLITPFIPFYAYNGDSQELFYGDLPAGKYDIVLVCDIRNGHLDITKLNTGSTLAGMYAFRSIHVR